MKKNMEQALLLRKINPKGNNFIPKRSITSQGIVFFGNRVYDTAINIKRIFKNLMKVKDNSIKEKEILL